MAYDYIKQHYGVPVKVGGRVTMRDNGRTGVVVRKRCYTHYVFVRFDGARRNVPVHPLDLDYGVE